MGESGCVPAAGAIVSAIESALTPFGVRITEYPVTPARLFTLLAGKLLASPSEATAGGLAPCAAMSVKLKGEGLQAVRVER